MVTISITQQHRTTCTGHTVLCIAPRRTSVCTLARQPVIITSALIQALGGLSLPDAARTVGISPTAFKRACRRLGVRRWEYRRGPARHDAGGCPTGPDPARDPEAQAAADEARSTASRSRLSTQPASMSPSSESDTSIINVSDVGVELSALRWSADWSAYAAPRPGEDFLCDLLAQSTKYRLQTIPNSFGSQRILFAFTRARSLPGTSPTSAPSTPLLCTSQSPGRPDWLQPIWSSDEDDLAPSDDALVLRLLAQPWR